MFGKKGGVFSEKFFSLHTRFPKILHQAALKELGCFLSHCPESFLETRSLSLLSKVFISLYRVMQATLGGGEQIHYRLLPLTPAIYGIAVAFPFLHETKRFNEKHILKAIKNLVPGITPLPASYLSYQSGTTTLYYLEVKKIRGNGFSKNEKMRLHNDLSSEFKKAVESIPYSLFLPGNEEELFKNIRHLSQEIKYVRDLPQVMIKFVEYDQNVLKFLVTVLRVIKPTTPPLVSLSSQLPALIHFSLEKLFCVGKLRKKYPKEAAIFTLEVQSSSFLRNNQAVNLRSARLFIVKSIECMLGPFRDYNGGLLKKENEQLAAIKSALEAKGSFCSFLEDLFYGIKPIDMRALITVETGIEMARHLQKMLLTPLDSEKKYVHHFFHSQTLRLAVIKTIDPSWKSSLPSRLFGYSSQIGCSFLEKEGFFYFCFFHQYATSDILFDALRYELSEHAALSLTPEKKIFNINFQNGDPLSLNPHLATDMPSHIMANFLFEGLTAMGPSGKPKPAAAEAIEIAPCQTKYTFHLRKAWWSNGEELTAYHFEKAWKKTVMQNSGSAYPDFFFLIKNARLARFKAISIDEVGIKALNSKTLYVELEKPCPYFLDLLATPIFFPMFSDDEEPSEFNGPFTVTEWRHHQFLNLSQNPFYWDGKHMKLGGLKIHTIKDPKVALEMFQREELDFIGDPIAPLCPEFLKQPEITSELIHKTIARIFWIHCNLRKAPLNNKNIRKALSLAIDRERLVHKVFPHQIPHSSPFPYKYSGQKLDHHDVKLARRYFKKGLQELGITLEQFPVLHYTHSELAFEIPLFEELKLQWSEVLKIELHSKPLRWNEFSAVIDKGTYDLCGLFRRDFFNHIYFYLSFFKSSNGTQSIDLPEYDALIEEAEMGKKKASLKKIESILLDYVPVIPLVNQKFTALISKKIKGFRWEENGCLNVKDVLIDEKES